MECLELALKSSFRKKMLMNLSPQLRFNDLGSLSAENVDSCDDFSVDELLNFSNEEECEEAEDGEEEKPEKNEDDKGFASVSVLSQERLENCENPNESSGFCVEDGFGCLPTTELGVPADDLAELEWLSHFVEDSVYDYSAPFPAGIWTGKSNQRETTREPEASISPKPCFETRSSAKARSKRARAGGRFWVLGSPTLTESSSNSTTSSSSCSSPSSPLLFYNTGAPLIDDTIFPFEKPLAKKPKNRPPVNVNIGSGIQTTRRCSHCGVQKTPQWRAGPLGSKTLCNACGVRYKSGRLLPEYRPACSPTFSTELHSNHHRKVLEMRRNKEDSPPQLDRKTEN